MVELTVLNFLERRLPYPVSMEKPEKEPERYYVLRKAGSDREDYVDSAVFVVMSYAESMLEAAKMNEAAKIEMDNLIELDSISASKRNGDYPFPDTQTKRYRYQTVHNITYF